ncbi:MAG: primase [Solirubrobacteraceae bacterium]|jgi:DNA primase|nr:primase [Solirubrobacteraceae bacterium]
MALYTNDSKERVRDAVDMVDLVSSRTELKRAGANRFTGLCPFHDERTPSFGINPAEKVYYCFGCQASGDAFTFVMETEGADFKGALEMLADRYKVALELEDEDPQAAEKRQRRERLLELLERTAAYYVRQLWESKEAERARTYLAQRGLEEGTLREFRVGYAPSAWDTVLNASRRAKFSNRELYDAGLVQKSQKSGQIYDRFRSQIIFPLADARGRVKGFAGRTLGGEEDRRPKYVNSAESDLFHKRSQLFGADLARAASAKAGRVVVAEGYTDVIAMHQAGIRNSVAIMGTAVTEEQIAELVRLAPLAQLTLDADNAGQEAMLRAARLAEGRGLKFRVVPLPPGEDPAELIQRGGKEEIERRVAESVSFARFKVQHALDTGDLDSADGKDLVLAQLGDLFKLTTDVERNELGLLVADRLGLPPDLVWEELRSGARRPAAARRDGATQTAAPRASTALHRRERTERAFLGYCIALPKLGAPALAELDLDADISTPVIRRAAQHLRDHLDAPTDALPADDPELSDLVAELSVRATMLAEAPPAAFEAERLQLELFRLDREITEARSAAAGDISGLAAKRFETQARLARAVEQAMGEGVAPA